MADDIRTIANEALLALAASLARVAELSAELDKRASLATPDKDLVELVVSALTKVGALTELEGALAALLFGSDPNASLRCIAGLLSARSLAKTASLANESLLFGTLVSSARIDTPAPKLGRTRVLEILRQST